jgi:hypothetical protein
MAATIQTTAERIIDMLDGSDHPEAERITRVLAKLTVAAAGIADDDVPQQIEDDLGAIAYCVEDWAWAGDHSGAQVVRCTDVLQRHEYQRTMADVLADVRAAMARPAPLALAA